MKLVTAIGVAALALSVVGISGCSDSDSGGSDSSASGGSSSSDVPFNESCIAKDFPDSNNYTTIFGQKGGTPDKFDQSSNEAFAAGVYEAAASRIQNMQLVLNDEQLADLKASASRAIEDYVNNGGDLAPKSRTLSYVVYSANGDKTPGQDTTDLEPEVNSNGQKRVRIQEDPTNDYCVSISPSKPS